MSPVYYPRLIRGTQHENIGFRCQHEQSSGFLKESDARNKIHEMIFLRFECSFYKICWLLLEFNKEMFVTLYFTTKFNKIWALHKDDCFSIIRIHRFSVIPLSTNSGLIGWVPHTDTLHSLIRDYREKKKILLNIEHRLMLRVGHHHFMSFIKKLLPIQL